MLTLCIIILTKELIGKTISRYFYLKNSEKSMKKKRIFFRLLIIMVFWATILSDARGEPYQSKCVRDESTVLSWSVVDPKDGNYWIIWKNSGRGEEFYLCNGVGDDADRIKKVEILIDPNKQGIAEASCSTASGSHGDEYFAVVDIKSYRVVHAYYFNFYKKDVERISAENLSCVREVDD